jgi:hypothetical protein
LCSGAADIGGVVGVIGDKYTLARSLKHHQAAVSATAKCRNTSYNFPGPFDVFKDVAVPFAGEVK